MPTGHSKKSRGCICHLVGKEVIIWSNCGAFHPDTYRGLWTKRTFKAFELAYIEPWWYRYAAIAYALVLVGLMVTNHVLWYLGAVLPVISVFTYRSIPKKKRERRI